MTLDPDDDRDAPPASSKDRPGTPRRLRARWQQAALVCRQCQKRGSGPAKLKAKRLMRGLREGFGGARDAPRIVPVQCLGLCPKRAIAVALPAEGGRLAIFAVTDEDELPAALAIARGDAS